MLADFASSVTLILAFISLLVTASEGFILSPLFLPLSSVCEGGFDSFVFAASFFPLLLFFASFLLALASALLSPIIKKYLNRLHHSSKNVIRNSNLFQHYLLDLEELP